MATMILKDVTLENFLDALQGKHTEKNKGKKVIKRFVCLLRYISVLSICLSIVVFNFSFFVCF